MSERLVFDNMDLRSVTTGRMHSADVGGIYTALERIYGEEGFMTHMLPNLREAALPWLRQQTLDARFWDGAYDPAHKGTVTIPAPTAEERDAMWSRYKQLPHPFSSR